MVFLLWDWGDFDSQTTKLLLRPINLAMDLGALAGIKRDGGANQAAVLPTGDGHHHLQVPQQLGDEGCRRVR
jgi:hypothetical protein